MKVKMKTAAAIFLTPLLISQVSSQAFAQQKTGSTTSWDPDTGGYTESTSDGGQESVGGGQNYISVGSGSGDDSGYYSSGGQIVRPTLIQTGSGQSSAGATQGSSSLGNGGGGGGVSYYYVAAPAPTPTPSPSPLAPLPNSTTLTQWMTSQGYKAKQLASYSDLQGMDDVNLASVNGSAPLVDKKSVASITQYGVKGSGIAMVMQDKNGNPLLSTVSMGKQNFVLTQVANQPVVISVPAECAQQALAAGLVQSKDPRYGVQQMDDGSMMYAAFTDPSSKIDMTQSTTSPTASGKFTCTFAANSASNAQLAQVGACAGTASGEASLTSCSGPSVPVAGSVWKAPLPGGGTSASTINSAANANQTGK